MRKNYIKIIITLIFLSLLNSFAFAKEMGLQANYLFEIGKKYYNQKNYPEAINEFNKCLMAQPDCAACKEYLVLAEEKTVTREVIINNTFREIEKREKAQKITKAEETPKPVKAAEKESVPETIVSEKKELTPQTEKGAWTIPKGRLYCESYNKYYWHKSKFDDKGKRVGWAYNGKYTEMRTELKLEYGATDDLTLLLYLPYKEAHWKDDNAKSTTKALVDIWTGAKYRLFSQPCVFTLQARLKIPTNYNPNDSPSLGARQVDAEIKMLLGKSLWPFMRGYTKFELGFRARNEEPTNEIPYFYELGYNLRNNLILKATLDGIEGISGTGKLDEDYTKWNLSTIFKIKEYLNLELGYGQTFAGKNSSAAEEIILSLSSQF